MVFIAGKKPMRFFGTKTQRVLNLKHSPLRKSSDRVIQNLVYPITRFFIAPGCNSQKNKPQILPSELFDAADCSSLRMASSLIKSVTLPHPSKLCSSAPNRGASRRLQAMKGCRAKLSQDCMHVVARKLSSWLCRNL